GAVTETVVRGEPCLPTRSANSALTSPSIASADRPTRSPARVGRQPLARRTIRRTPRARSKAEIRRETVALSTPSSRAAADAEPARHAARSMRRSLHSGITVALLHRSVAHLRLFLVGRAAYSEGTRTRPRE